MRLLNPLAFLLIFALSASTAMSAQSAASSSDSTQFPVKNTDPGVISLTASGNSYESAIAELDHAKRIQLSPFAGVCALQCAPTR
jgi:hypothetical protein